MQHWQKLRDERKETYLSFLGAVEEFQFEIAKFHAALGSSTPDQLRPLTDQVRRTTGDRLTELYRKCNRVGLAGPDDIADLAGTIRVAATRAFARLEDHVRNGTRPNSESVRAYLRSLDELIALQRQFVDQGAQLLREQPSQ
ncbi:hypothetical protein [Streptomyces kronopolitis]|uniref:hypothetical protein n=1 Tax=Streptomyces kronopolitis TaxID=1612435 RepID=UPI0020BDCBAC|nr:hypothetical protein [Streptomyces kronopolitis]MCL6302835.1 hypothetical protein [Streptomyces kronopolitis]